MMKVNLYALILLFLLSCADSAKQQTEHEQAIEQHTPVDHDFEYEIGFAGDDIYEATSNIEAEIDSIYATTISRLRSLDQNVSDLIDQLNESKESYADFYASESQIYSASFDRASDAGYFGGEFYLYKLKLHKASLIAISENIDVNYFE